jgi:hypothetical protein
VKSIAPKPHPSAPSAAMRRRRHASGIVAKMRRTGEPGAGVRRQGRGFGSMSGPVFPERPRIPSPLSRRKRDAFQA